MSWADANLTTRVTVANCHFCQLLPPNVISMIESNSRRPAHSSCVTNVYKGVRKVTKNRQTARPILRQAESDDGPANRIRAPRTSRYLTALPSHKKTAADERPSRAAKIESAGALSGNLKARVRADLTRIYGPLKFSFVEIQALIGGMRITVGNDLYCGSVSQTLESLEVKSGNFVTSSHPRSPASDKTSTRQLHRR